MEKKFEKADTDYVLRLDEEHRVRYRSKLEDIGGFDPYAKLNQKEKWSKDIHSIPSISYGDIFNYLVYGQSRYTFEEFKSYKSLEAHQQFTNGWVQDVETYKPANSDNFVIRSK
ncbi:hypothetical protein ElyMa_000658800, partial [Elysia marginata]